MDTEVKDEDVRNETAPEVKAAPPVPAGLSQSEVAWRLDERRALAISKGGDAIPKQYRDRPGAILAAWAMGDELGIGRMQALRNIFVVNGRPTLNGDLMLALARGANCRVRETFVQGEIDEIVDPEGGAKEMDPRETYARCEIERPDGEAVDVRFTVQDAMQAGLWQSNDVWRKYPKRMMQMRARAFAIRDAVPEILAGVSIEGEIENG